MNILVLTLPEESHVKQFMHFFNFLKNKGNKVTVYIKESHKNLFEDTKITLKYYDQFFLDNIFNFNSMLSGKNSKFVPKNNFMNTDLEYRGKSLEAGYLFRCRCINKHLKYVDEDFSKFDLLIYDYYLYYGYFIRSKYGLKSMTLISTLLPCSSIREENLQDFLYMNYFLDYRDTIESKEYILKIVDDISKEVSKKTQMEFNYFDSFFSETNIVASSEELYPASYMENGEKKFYFIGRESSSRNVSLEKNSDINTILVYLGEIENEEHKDIMLSIIRLLSTSKYYAYVITRNLDSWMEEPIGEVPENIKCSSYFPIEEYLKKVDLFVSHGGLGSINEAAMAGIPMLLIPTSGERLINSKRIEELGGGLMLLSSKEEIDKYFLAYVKRLIEEDEFRGNSAKIGASLSGASEKINHTLKEIF